MAVSGVQRDGSLPTLSSPHEFLFLVLHFFREAWFSGSSIRLSQIADIVRSWDRLETSERTEMRTYIAETRVQPPVAWVAAHVDDMFGTGIVDTLNLSGFTPKAWTTSVTTQGTTRR